MKPFLQQVANHFYAAGNIGRCCFVFPNRRSMVFFRKYLSEAVRDDQGAVPVVAPQMLTINDLFFKAGQVSQTSRVALLLELYESYRELNPKAEPLDEFIFWGDVILGDFNDVDKYFVNARQLFANVADFKDLQDTFTYLTDTQRKAIEGFISHFSDVSGKLTVDLDTDNPDVKGRFLKIWNILYPLYVNFNARLSEKSMAYEGMVYRSLAERLKDAPVEDVFNGIFSSDVRFVFVGLNALNECEKILLRKLCDCSRAEFCWDYSGKMISSPQNRSSLFMSDNVKEFPQAASWDAEGLEVPKVRVVSVASSIGQAKRIPDILAMSGLPQNGEDLSRTAIILPDEGLLVPVLNSIPESIHDINVTMGLPMGGSHLFSLMSEVASLQMHSAFRHDEWLFYHKQVWNIFSNELFRRSLDKESAAIVAKVKASAKYYIPQRELSGTPLLDAVFVPVIKNLKVASAEQIRDFAEYLKGVITTLAPRIADDAKIALELEFAKEYYKNINVLEENSLSILPTTYIRLLVQLLSSVAVPFRGEPLKGLQIMGPLEMRALDFNNLIILSANEGVFPRKSVSSSFIPPELRRGFGLPTYEYQDAVWAYYFYRAISRAENVWMLVDSRTEGLKSGEESRYIKQLEYHFALPLERYVVGIDNMATSDVPDIVKTQEDIDKAAGIVMSATAIQDYLACPASFYYAFIKDLKAEEEVAESLDYGMLGTVFHDTMHALYTSESAMAPDFVFDRRGKNEKALTDRIDKVSRDYICSWIRREDDIRRKIKALIMEQLKAIDVTGRNLVVADVILKYVIKTLKRDLEQLEASGLDSFEIIGREMPVFGEFHGWKFKGFIDRIDAFTPDQARIVDYKTGKVLQDDEDIHDGNALAIAEKIFARDVAERPKIALQFFIYDLLVKDYDFVKGRKICNSVYSTASLFKQAPQTYPLNETFFNEVSSRLKELLDEICNPEVPFRRTRDEKVCSYCDFKTICGR